MFSKKVFKINDLTRWENLFQFYAIFESKCSKNPYVCGGKWKKCLKTMTYKSARKVGKNNLMFMPIFPVCTLILSIYKKLLKKLRGVLRNSGKVGIAIYTKGNSFPVAWDNPNILGKMAYLARHFFSQSETPTFN
jgi:hypothetical protein